MDEILLKLKRIEQLTILGAKNVLNLEEVAILTGLTKAYLYKLSSSKQIPHYKPTGKVIYFDKKEIESWLKRNRVSSSEEMEGQALNYCLTGKVKGGVL